MRTLSAGLLALIVLGPWASADAQPRRSGRPAMPVPQREAAAPTSPAPSVATPPQRVFRSHFGIEIAETLMRSTDPDERLRGVERLAEVHTEEALSLLNRASAPTGVATTDPRALLVVVRALATWTEREHARTALANVIKSQSLAFATRPLTAPSHDPAAEDTRGAGRILLARRQAAIALAGTQDARVSEELLSIGRSAGPGGSAALDALALFPPITPVLGGVALTTPGTIKLAVDVGDLRSLDSIDGAARTSDPALRAAAISALGIMGDGRAIGLARAAAHDPDPGVRVAAAAALVHLGMADAAAAVEALIGDVATSREGLKLAAETQGEGITRAAAAKALVTGDEDLRLAAVEALSRQTSTAAIEALSRLIADPVLESDAAFAIARSPSVAAMAALEAMAAAPTAKRLAARAYFARRVMRGSRGLSLDALLDALARSSSASDRAVGVQALVALGAMDPALAMGDKEASVRRGAILGAMAASVRDRAAMAAQLARETDGPTREVLIGALIEAGSDGAVPTSALIDLVEGGRPGAPLAALALARRADADLAPRIDDLLASNDPILRAHAARGLAESNLRDAVGRLAQAYAWEGDTDVRRAIIEGLGSIRSDAPTRLKTLELAARLDPDRITRWTARRALDGAPPDRRVPARDVAWIRLIAAPGSTASTTPLATTASLARPDGLARVIAFDDDGYALVAGVPAGQALLRLAPRLAAYESASP
jgi:HEAT repeat protein